MTVLTVPETKYTLRRDRAFWQRAAAGALALSVVLNTAMYGAALYQRRYIKDLESAYKYSETAREAAVQSCGELLQKVQGLEAELAMRQEPVPVAIETAAPVSRYAPISSEEREMLARLVWLEARGEPFEGQQAVAEVVLNRVAAENFPGTVAEVINQEHQFTPAAQIPGVTPTETQYNAVDAALYGENVLPVDVVYFSVEGENKSVWGEIGGHVFCYQYG